VARNDLGADRDLPGQLLSCYRQARWRRHVRCREASGKEAAASAKSGPVLAAQSCCETMSSPSMCCSTKTCQRRPTGRSSSWIGMRSSRVTRCATTSWPTSGGRWNDAGRAQTRAVPEIEESATSRPRSGRVASAEPAQENGLYRALDDVMKCPGRGGDRLPGHSAKERSLRLLLDLWPLQTHAHVGTHLVDSQTRCHAEC